MGGFQSVISKLNRKFKLLSEKVKSVDKNVLNLITDFSLVTQLSILNLTRVT
jgi:hypothetical protein